MAAWAPGPGETDVDTDELLLLGCLGDLLGCLLGCVGRGLVLGLLDDHSSGCLGDCLGTGDVGQGDHDVVVTRVDVGDSPFCCH